MLYIKIAGKIAVMYAFHKLLYLILRLFMKFKKINYLENDHRHYNYLVLKPSFGDKQKTPLC
jgi:hypothetical protein